MAALQGSTKRLFRKIEELTETSCGPSHMGGITLTDDHDRCDMLLVERAKHRPTRLQTEIVETRGDRGACAIVYTQGIVGAYCDPLDGHPDPRGKRMPNLHIPRDIWAVARTAPACRDANP